MDYWKCYSNFYAATLLHFVAIVVLSTSLFLGNDVRYETTIQIYIAKLFKYWPGGKATVYFELPINLN